MAAKKKTTKATSDKPKPKRNRRAVFAEDVDASTGGESKRIRPSHIQCDHSENQRYSGYAPPKEIAQWLTGSHCCFTLAEIETRLADLLTEGQINPVEVSISGTQRPVLEMGFLRHAAFLLAEARGLMDKIPKAKGAKCTGINANVVPRAKSQADRVAKSRRNLSENESRKPLTPVDRATAMSRRLSAMLDDGSKITRGELAAEYGRKIDYVHRHLRLLSDLRPEQLLEVHEGKVAMAIALRQASAEGRGNSRKPRGANPGISLGIARKRLAVLDPSKLPEGVTEREYLLAQLIAGELPTDDDSVPEDLRAFVELLATAPPKPERKTKSAKKTPPHMGPKTD